MSEKKPTSTDVAKLAHVSQTTVSMILGGRSQTTFSPETVERVYQAASELGYSPKAGRSHRTRSAQSGTRVVVAIAPTLSNPYYSELVHAIELEAEIRNYRLFICNTYYDAELEGRYIRYLLSSDFAGAVFTYMPTAAKYLQMLSGSMPVVVISDHVNRTNFDMILLNNYKAGCLMARHLLELGHRRFEFIASKLDENHIQRVKRLEGIKETLEKAGASIQVHQADTDISVKNDPRNYEYNTGYSLTSRICDSSNATAYVGVNDMVAFGVIDALEDHGYKVPEKCSVGGFDNIFPSQFKRISLTTVDSFLEEKGRDAIDVLMQKINGTAESEEQRTYQIEYEPKLVMRGSTAKKA